MVDKEITVEIITEMYKAFEKLGAMSDLLSIVGSYGDTLKDTEVLEELIEWNKVN